MLKKPQNNPSIFAVLFLLTALLSLTDFLLYNAVSKADLNFVAAGQLGSVALKARQVTGCFFCNTG